MANSGVGWETEGDTPGIVDEGSSAAGSRPGDFAFPGGVRAGAASKTLINYSQLVSLRPDAPLHAHAHARLLITHANRS